MILCLVCCQKVLIADSIGSMKLLFSFVLLACAAPQLRAEEFVFKGGTQSEGKVLSFEKGDFNLLINDKKEKKAGIQIQSISWGEAGVPITPTSGELKDQLITLEKFEGGKFFIKLQDGTSKELTSMSLGRIVFGSGEKISYASKAVSYTHLTLPTNREV